VLAKNKQSPCQTDNVPEKREMVKWQTIQHQNDHWFFVMFSSLNQMMVQSLNIFF